VQRRRATIQAGKGTLVVRDQGGLEETDGGIWAIHFNTVLLATFDERDCVITG
jgi:hypothetical protein